MVLIYRKVHPYFVDLNLEKDTPDFWRENFKKEEVSDYVIPHGYNFLVIIVNGVQGHKVFAKILKLRTLRPKKIDITTGEEREIQLLDTENIIESSHFVYYIRDKVILAEYNHDGVRHLKSPLTSYFEKRFDIDDDIEIFPLPDRDTLENMRNNRIFKRVTVKLAREKLVHGEQNYGIPLINTLFNKLTTENHAKIEISIRKSNKRRDSLSKRETLGLVDNLLATLGADGLDQLKIEGEDGEYDVLHNNLIRYHIPVDMVEGAFDPEQFYSGADAKYTRERDTLIETLQSLT